MSPASQASTQAGLRADVAVVGGGIVGLATALALVEGGRRSVVVLEAEGRLAGHQSSHNSGVIHAGLYYKPGSLKARLCAEGREAMIGFCEQEGVAYERCGKLVVATRPEELPALDEIERRGQANGLTGLRRLTGEEIAEFEPHAAGLAALHVPQTGIVDYAEVAAAMARRVQAAGGSIRTGARLIGCRAAEGGLVLETTAGSVHAACLVACAGLQSDRVARLCGLEPGVAIVPFRGVYWQLSEGRRHLVQNPIYPVPDPRFPFLGVHFTRSIHGGIEVGPNAVPAFQRGGYGRRAFDARDTADMLAFGGTWRLYGRYWRTGLGEIYRQARPSALAQALARLVPEVRAEDLVAGGSGVRAQAVTPEGRMVDDFHLVEAERMIHVLNAPSPAATASLAIGRYIAALAEGRLAR